MRIIDRNASNWLRKRWFTANLERSVVSLSIVRVDESSSSSSMAVLELGILGDDF